jgi:hypothetical protein
MGPDRDAQQWESNKNESVPSAVRVMTKVSVARTRASGARTGARRGTHRSDVGVNGVRRSCRGRRLEVISYRRHVRYHRIGEFRSTGKQATVIAVGSVDDGGRADGHR